jgi:hypothetical protein
LVLRFFGLTPENKDIILEQIFLLMQHLNFSYLDAYKLPIWKRNWFLGRIRQNIEQQIEMQQSKTKSNSSQSIFKKTF